MAEVAAKPAATDESQESWEFHESESWSNHEKEVTGKLVASRNSENSGILKLEAEKMDINFIFLQQLNLTWNRSIRSYDKFMAEIHLMT